VTEVLVSAVKHGVFKAGEIGSGFSSFGRHVRFGAALQPVNKRILHKRIRYREIGRNTGCLRFIKALLIRFLTLTVGLEKLYPKKKELSMPLFYTVENFGVGGEGPKLASHSGFGFVHDFPKCSHLLEYAVPVEPGTFQRIGNGFGFSRC